MSQRPADPLSPVPGIGLEGYTQQTALRAGEPVEVMLSGDGEAQVSVLRLIHGDPNPAGPGYRAQPAPWGGPTAVRLAPQPLDLGSYLEIPDRPTLRTPQSLTLALWIYPTRLTGGWQAVAAKWAPGDIGFGLFCVGNGTLAGAVSHDGHKVSWCAGRQFVEAHAWQFVALIFDADRGELVVHQHAPEGSSDLERRRWNVTEPIRSVTSAPSAGLHASGAPLRFGALAHPDPSTRCHWGHFEGKLASPALLAEAAGDDLLAALEANPLAVDRSTVVGIWDLSRDVSSSRIVDLSSHGHHGVAVNRPARAVTGPRWAGTAATLYSDGPNDYDSVHLHGDDLADPGWDPSLEIEVPADARSGIYAVQVRSDADTLWLPLVVAPSVSAADLCVVVPTLTWQAYSSNRAPYSFTEDGMVDQPLCIYDTHADGSPVLYATRRKPTRAGDPTAGIRQWGAHTVPANLYLIDWLEHQGHGYEVLADQHLHELGHAALEPYRCIILGSHHEYWTVQMLDALEHYLQGGGRCMYLGGNGLYWVTSFDPEQPWVIEVRKSGDGDYEEYFARPQPGQMQHSTTLEVGGLWSRRGRPARRLVGVEHSANVFTEADGRWGFQRLPASYDDPYGFVFDGVDTDVIGDYGLNLGTAAGYEMDSVLEWRWPVDWEPTRLARATHETFLAPMRMPVPAACDIALTAAPQGAAVFAAGSVTWTGSLSHANYSNDVARITDNVLRRFLTAPAGASVLDGRG